MAGNSNHYDSMVAIKSVIDALSLSGLTGGTVIQEVASYQDGQQTLPFISISPYGPEKTDEATNVEDAVGYGIMVAIIAKPDVTSLEARLAWRQKLRRRFKNTSFDKLGVATLPTNWKFQIHPGPVVQPNAWFDRSAFVSGMVVEAWFQEPRS